MRPWTNLQRLSSTRTAYKKNNSPKNIDTVFIQLDKSRDLHGTVCHCLEDVGKKTIELKRKADDAHDRIKFHRDLCRRATKDLVSAEERTT